MLIGLGTWQLQRLGWKEALIAERQARMAEAPITLSAEDRGLSQELAHRRVVLRGRFLHDKEMFFGLRAEDGEPGLELLTPLRTADGMVVVVNRGWIPARQRDAGQRPETLIQGPVEVVGVLRPDNPSPSIFTPGNDPGVNRWYSYDLATMSAYLGLELAPFVVEATAAPGQRTLPLGRRPAVNLTNNHLQYAITWYALAAALAVIFILYHRRGDASA